MVLLLGVYFNEATKERMLAPAVHARDVDKLDALMDLEGFVWKSSYIPSFNGSFMDRCQTLYYCKWVHKRALPFDFQLFLDRCNGRVDRDMLEWFASIGVYARVDSPELWESMCWYAPDALEYIIRHYPK